MSFANIAIKFLKNKGYEPVLCSDEDEARRLVKTLPSEGKWPCLFNSSNTTGEKFIEEFYTDQEDIDNDRFISLGVIKNKAIFDEDLLTSFEADIKAFRTNLHWSKKNLLKQFIKLLPDFKHQEANKYLDSKM